MSIYRTAWFLLLVGSSASATPIVDTPVLEALKRDAEVRVSFSLKHKTYGFQHPYDVDPIPLFESAFPWRFKRDHKADADGGGYSSAFQKTLIASKYSPTGGAVITALDLELLQRNDYIDVITTPLPVEPSDNAAYNLTQSQFLRDTFGLTGSGVDIAVLDQNIDTTHTSLQSSNIREFCFSNASDCDGQPTLTQIGKLLVQIPRSGPGTADGPTNDAWPHGTAVTGLIASSAGPAPLSPVRDGNVLAFRITQPTSTSSNGFTVFLPDAQLVNAALEWIITENNKRLTKPGTGENVRIVNLSLGVNINVSAGAQLYNYRTCEFYIQPGPPGISIQHPDFIALATNVLRLQRQGVLVVAATGNFGDTRPFTTNAPACFGNVLSASSTGNGVAIPPLAAIPAEQNIGSHQRTRLTKVGAPGALMTLPWMTFSGGTFNSLLSSDIPGGIALSGTSFSTPVAVACASQLMSASPSATAPQILTAITRSGTFTATAGGNDFSLPALRCDQSRLLLPSPSSLKATRFPTSGTWYRNTQGGQGFLIEVNNENPSAPFVFGGWYTYARTGLPNDDFGQRWFVFQTAAGFSAQSNVIPLTVYTTTSGNFQAPPYAQLAMVGSASLRFDSCTSARFIYNINVDGLMVPGDFEIERLYSPIRCHENDTMQGNLDSILPAADEADNKRFAYTGSYANVLNQYDGLVIEINPAGLNQLANGSLSRGSAFVSWYTYTPNQSQPPNSPPTNKQRWFTMQQEDGNPFPPTSRTINLRIGRTTGLAFGDGGGVRQFTDVGSATLTFNDPSDPILPAPECSYVTLNYSFGTNAGDFAGMTGSARFNRLGATYTGCP